MKKPSARQIARDKAADKAARAEREAIEQLTPITLTIHCDERVIQTSVMEDSSACMIADGLKTAYLKKFHHLPRGVTVDLQTIRFTHPDRGLRYIYITPRTAARGLVQFDQGIRPSPFTFRLGINEQQGGCQVVKSRPKTARENAKYKDTMQKRRAAETKSKKKLNQSSSKKVSKAGLEKMQELLDGPKKVLNPEKQSGDQIIVGGSSPTRATLPGSRRTFGIKDLGDINDATDKSSKTRKHKRSDEGTTKKKRTTKRKPRGK